MGKYTKAQQIAEFKKEFKRLGYDLKDIDFDRVDSQKSMYDNFMALRRGLQIHEPIRKRRRN